MKNSYVGKPASVVAAVFASAMLLSCENELQEASVIRDLEKIPVEVSVPAVRSKVSNLSEEDKVNDLQIFVFRPDGTLDAYSAGAGRELVLECTSGEREFVALVNAPYLASIQSRTQLNSLKSDLNHNSEQGLVMSGSAVKTIGSADDNVEVPVSRLVARVSVKKVTNAFTSPGYAGIPVTLKSIYLSNVAADAYYLNAGQPSSWHNKSGSKNDCRSLLCDDGLDIDIAKGSSYGTPHYFYCYANPTETDSSDDVWSPRRTRLVLETVIGNTTCYYPVTLPQIEANHTYDINEVKITRLGSDDPDEAVETGAVSVSIKVMDWETGASTEITI